MTLYKYGNSNADIVFIQPIGDHDLPEMEHEVAEIRKQIPFDFQLIAVKVAHWNHDLSPWHASAVFGNEDFGDGAPQTLTEILKLCSDKTKTYYIGGYSLAGLFALWASYQTDCFSGVAAASPSIWFPGFLAYMKAHAIQSDTVYFSLGEKEEKSRNTVLSKVGDCIREGYAWLQEKGIHCILEWNSGGHFKDPAIRTAKAFAWIVKTSQIIPNRPEMRTQPHINQNQEDRI